MMKEYEAKHPDVQLNVGTRRSVTIEFFGRLPEDDQAKYRAMATERLVAIRALGTLSNSEKTKQVTLTSYTKMSY
jgi:hypothetical protein